MLLHRDRYRVHLGSENELVLFYERVSAVHIHFCGSYSSAGLQQLFHIHILFHLLFHLRMQNSLL
jgi:hypothetical protein